MGRACKEKIYRIAIHGKQLRLLITVKGRKRNDFHSLNFCQMTEIKSVQ